MLLFISHSVYSFFAISNRTHLTLPLHSDKDFASPKPVYKKEKKKKKKRERTVLNKNAIKLTRYRLNNIYMIFIYIHNSDLLPKLYITHVY